MKELSAATPIILRIVKPVITKNMEDNTKVGKDYKNPELNSNAREKRITTCEKKLRGYTEKILSHIIIFLTLKIY